MKNADQIPAADHAQGTPQPPTAADIIGNSADRFFCEFGREPLPGETCQQYIEYLKQTRPPLIVRPNEEKPATPYYDTYTETQVLYIIQQVLRCCIEDAARIITPPEEFIAIAEAYSQYATENAGHWIAYPGTKRSGE